MGAADIVPGVSGGTMAFILGIYENFIHSIKSLTWKYLLPILLGISVAIAAFAPLITNLLNHETYREYLYALFFGLILASVLYCAKQLKKWSWTILLFFIIGTIGAFLLTTLPFQKNEGYTFAVSLPSNITFDSSHPIRNYDPEQHLLLGVSSSELSALLAKGVIEKDTLVRESLQKNWVRVSSVVDGKPTPLINSWMVLCGAVGATAMLLPGISGSYMLHILGAYIPTIEALANMVRFTFERESFSLLLSLGCGIILGALLFSRVISYFLQHFHDPAIALLAGFMIGAMRTIWPFWHYAYVLVPLKLVQGTQLEPVTPYLPDPTGNHFLISVFVAVFGLCLVLVMERVANRKKEFPRKEQNR